MPDPVRNTTINTASPNTRLNKTFYDRQLLESVKTRLVHAKYGQIRPIPLNNGKSVEFRRWNLFDIDDNRCALTEGVTPTGQTLSQTSVDVTVGQYGAYVEISDLLEATAFDRVVEDSAELLGEQIGTVLEWVTRDALSAGNNVQYAGDKTARSSIEATDKLTTTEIRKAVRTLKRAKARPFGSETRKPHFICICSPEATYDLQNDQLWQDVSKYSNAEAVYSGEIGRIFGVVFVESTETKIIKQAVHTQVASHTAGSADVVVDEITDDAYAFLSASGAKVTIGSTEYQVASLNKATKTITLAGTPPASQIAADTYVFSTEAGALSETKVASDVHLSLIFGKDAYGIVSLEDRGALEIIIKPRGSAGADDPLDQRATVGAKATAFAAAILNDLWLLRIEHGVSA